MDIQPTDGVPTNIPRTQAMDASEYDYQTLANAKYVASKIQFSFRKENLSRSQHAEVAALPHPFVTDFLR